MEAATFATILDCTPGEVLCVGQDGTLIYANRRGRDLLGLDEDARGTQFFELFEEPAAKVAARVGACAETSTWQPLSLTLRCGTQAGLRLALRCRGMRDPESGTLHALVTADHERQTVFEEHRKLIRELNAKLAEQCKMRIKLDASLRNETRLRQELIHRVKNNLMLLMSLIRSRASTAQDPAVKSALEDIQARVMSIGLVHKLLDQHKGVDVVDTRELLEALCNQMETSICPPGVTISRDLTPYKMHVSDATALALLINELVTNSLKHAFDGRDSGKVDIALKRNGIDKIEVHVADDGAGYKDANTGHGSRIVEALASQLRGELSVKSDSGTSWQLIFAPSEVSEPQTH